MNRSHDNGASSNGSDNTKILIYHYYVLIIK